MKGFFLTFGSLFAVSALILVLAGVGGGGAPGAWLPHGVTEVDLHGFGVALGHTKGSPIARRVTDPAQVKRMIAWFNRLDYQHDPGACAESRGPDVTITFRSASGGGLATADSPPVTADGCNPIYFARGGYNSPLVDRNGAHAFIDRVEHLLRVTFAGGYAG